MPKRVSKPHVPAPSLKQQQADFTSEGAPPPGLVSTEPPQQPATRTASQPQAQPQSSARRS